MHTDNKTGEAPDEKGPVIEVVNLKTNEEEKFHMAWDNTLAEVWEEAYRRMGEERGPADQFQTQDGVSLAEYLGLTLADLRDRGIAANRKFAIRGETGGA